MFPVILDLSQVDVVLVGNGPAAARRLKQLRAGGASSLQIFSTDPCEELKALGGAQIISRWPDEDEVAMAGLLFLADMPAGDTERLASWARAYKVLVNSEDDRPHCDFHVPAMIRRGDLLLTVSTNGHSPGLARYLRQRLEADYGPEWAERLERLSALRLQWKAGGAGIPELAALTNDFLAREGLPHS